MRDETEQDRAAAAGVTRSVDLDADVGTVWDAIADPDLRRRWLDDEDAVERELRIDRVEPGRSLSWTWWHPGDEADASQVEIHLTELDGGTRVVVHEHLLLPPAARFRAEASVRAGRAWSHRLRGLELLFVAAGAMVA